MWVLYWCFDITWLSSSSHCWSAYASAHLFLVYHRTFLALLSCRSFSTSSPLGVGSTKTTLQIFGAHPLWCLNGRRCMCVWKRIQSHPQCWWMGSRHVLIRWLYVCMVPWLACAHVHVTFLVPTLTGCWRWCSKPWLKSALPSHMLRPLNVLFSAHSGCSWCRKLQ